MCISHRDRPDIPVGSLEAQVVEKGKVLHVCTESGKHRSVFLRTACARTPAQLNAVHVCKDAQNSIFQPEPSTFLDSSEQGCAADPGNGAHTKPTQCANSRFSVLAARRAGLRGRAYLCHLLSADVCAHTVMKMRSRKVIQFNSINQGGKRSGSL